MQQAVEYGGDSRFTWTVYNEKTFMNKYQTFSVGQQLSQQIPTRTFGRTALQQQLPTVFLFNPYAYWY